MQGKSARDQPGDKKRGRSIVRGGLTAGKRSVGLLGGIFSYGIRLGYRQEGINPAHNMGMPADTKRSFRLERDGWRAYWQAIAAAEEQGLAWQAIYIAKLLPLTGCRLNEIVGLTWAEVDFDGRCFHFDPDRVKSGPLRPIGREALALLRTLKNFEQTNRKRHSSGQASRFVFPKTRGVSDGPYAGMRKAWIRISPGFSPHCLRHAFGSAGEDEIGLHESTIAALFGHSTRQADVTRGYIRKADATLLAAADRVCRFVWEAMTGERAGAEIVSLDGLRA